VPAEKAYFGVSSDRYSVVFMCRMLKVSRSGYYAWKKRGPSARDIRDKELTEKLRTIHDEHDARLGVRRLHSELADVGERVSPKRVRRLARAANLHSCHPRPYKATTQQGKDRAGLVDLCGRDFTATQPDELWYGDVTYIKTWEGWVFLATVIDCYSRKVIGHAVANHFRTELTKEAIRSAIANRGGRVEGVIFHSDRGSNYTSVDFRDFCLDNRIIPSVGRTGSCYDNASSESFFATIKKEEIHRHPWATRTQVRRAIFEYIETYYNARRKHSTNGYKTPNQIEEEFDKGRIKAA
jgi:putative transposase